MSKRKSTTEGNLNKDFCDFLLELADFEKNNRNIHKYNAYRKAASVLAAHPTRISSGEEAIKLNGIGKKIADKIDEYLRTGKLRKLEEIRNDDQSVAIKELTRVTGIGPAKAEELYNSGISSIEELRKHEDKLTHHQRIGLKYITDFELKIPCSEIKEVEKIIIEKVSSLDPSYVITVCGSYRRGRAESGDVDVLITHPSFTSKDKPSECKLLKKIVQTLEKCGLVTDTLSLGDVKFMGVCKVKGIARRLDIRLTPHDQYHCATLYFTGSDVFNKEMRTHALANSFTLNEYTLRPLGATGVPGEPVVVHSERDVFECINFPYKEPNERG